MQRLFGIMLLILLVNCASFQKKKEMPREVDGIIFLDEDQEKKAEKNKKSARQYIANTTKEQKKTKKTEELRNLKNIDGIIFLDVEDQANEVPGQPFSPTFRKFERGKASYYAMSLKRNRTASGERYDPNKLTAAHPTLPFGTKVLVTNIYNGNSVVVRINDRGPHVKSRIIDLSYAAAQQLEMIRTGVADVTIEVVKRPNANWRKK